MDAIRIRDATPADLPVINDIYNHYVLHATCTYQTEPGTAEERAQWFAAHGPKHPVTLAELDGRVVGWGSLSRFHPRAAYGNTVEDSVYLHHQWLGRGIGSALLADLIARAQRIGHHTIIGGISADQLASIALHAKFGFAKAARLREVGFKFGRWLDVVWMQKML
ncbi:MAG TPA: GNAT family N-acetyltransferase [Verrucomicrobiae bacterium]|jgi:phosphinothricin acetyltransferase